MPVTRPDRATGARGSGLGALPYWAALLLATAGVTHIGLVLAIPFRSPGDAYARFQRAAKGVAWTTVAEPDVPATAPETDPALAGAFCLYDLGSTSAVAVDLDVSGAAYAALSVYGRHGQVLYGLTNRSAVGDHLALTVALTRPSQERTRGGGQSALARVRVDADEPLGIVRAQVLATAPSAMPEAAAAAQRLTCTPEVAPGETATAPR